MDYYSILGVNRNASDQDIRKAYKKKSMQHHPDRGGNEEEFKKVNEAYSTLKDPQKKAAYDNPHLNYRSQDFRSGNPFEDLFGFGNYNRRQRPNHDVTINVKLDLLDVIKGKELTIRYQVPSGKIKEANIDIPPGVEHGMGIRFEGLGDDSIPNFPNGNLIVKIKIIEPTNWKRSGNDLRTKVIVSIFDCMLGGKTEITTLDGKHLEMKIPKGTQPGAVFSIPHHGIPDIRRGTRGNIYVEINGIIPKIENQDILTDLERIKNALN